MDSILEELYFGNIDMNTQSFDRNSDVSNAMDTLVKVEDKLTELLEGKEKQLFLDYVNAWSEVNAETAVGRFMFVFIGEDKLKQLGKFGNARLE